MSNYSYLSDSYLKKFHDHFYGLKQLNPFTGYPLNRNEDFRPFFIIGSGRSGNTLLRRILDSHPELHIPPETYVLGNTTRVFRQNRHLSWENLVYLTLSQFEYHREFETIGIELRTLAEKLVTIPLQDRSLAFILNSFYQYHSDCNRVTFKRWGDKTPMNTFALDLILSVFPKAQFVHIVRDGCDVACSYVKANIYKSIDQAAQRWVDATNAASQFISKNQDICLEIKYERLVSEPQNIAEKICHFLEVPFHDSVLKSEKNAQKMGDVAMRSHHKQVFSPISVSSIGKGRKKISRQEKIIIQKIISDNLKKFGYEPCV